MVELWDEEELKRMGRILVRNREAFVLNNILRMREMFRYATKGLQAVFETMPFLLQSNTPGSPGHQADPETPCGIYGFARSGFWRQYRDSATGRILNTKEILGGRPRIESLLLMGSVGSVGHTESSDLDYWVCIEGNEFSGRELGLLTEKLEKLESWAGRVHKTEVHFYLHKVEDLREDRFGPLDEESAGPLMPGLIKEEFYRTALHVAGRMPLWWATPTKADAGLYAEIASRLEYMPVTTLDPGDFLDLGAPFRPGPKEYLAAAMWQAHKSQHDYFKALLKMVLLLEQVMGGLQKPLLCDKVKEAVLRQSGERSAVDPYLMATRQALNFAGRHFGSDELDLMRLAVWFKLVAPGSREILSPDSPKGRYLHGLLQEWEWDEARRADIMNYGLWPEQRKIGLGRKVKALLLELYSRTASRLRRDFPDEVLMGEDELVSLDLELLAHYSESVSKVETLPSELHLRGVRQGVSLVRVRDRWRIYPGSAGPEETGRDYVHSTDSLANAVAWLVHNRVWSPSLPCKVLGGTRPVERSLVQALAELLQASFPPLVMDGRKTEAGLIPDAVGPRILIINLESKQNTGLLESLEVIYRTGWGEMLVEAVNWPAGAAEAEKYLAAAEAVLGKHGAAEENMIFFNRPGADAAELIGNLKTAFRQYLRRKEREAREYEAPRSRSLLDTD